MPLTNAASALNQKSIVTPDKELRRSNRNYNSNKNRVLPTEEKAENKIKPKTLQIVIKLNSNRK